MYMFMYMFVNVYIAYIEGKYAPVKYTVYIISQQRQFASNFYLQRSKT